MGSFFFLRSTKYGGLREIGHPVFAERFGLNEACSCPFKKKIKFQIFMTSTKRRLGWIDSYCLYRHKFPENRRSAHQFRPTLLYLVTRKRQTKYTPTLQFLQKCLSKLVSEFQMKTKNPARKSKFSVRRPSPQPNVHYFTPSLHFFPFLPV